MNWDFVSVVVSVCGIAVASFADTQLHEFVSRNGEPGYGCNLDEGFWPIRDIPIIMGSSCGGEGRLCFVGSFVNTLCLAYVTYLVEKYMLKREFRAEACSLYQETTSVWIPWWKSFPTQGKDKKA